MWVSVVTSPCSSGVGFFFFAILPNLYLPPVLPCRARGVSGARGEAANTDCGSYGAFAKSLAMCVT